MNNPASRSDIKYAASLVVAQIQDTEDEDARAQLERMLQRLTLTASRTLVVMPGPSSFPFGHGRDAVRDRRKELDSAHVALTSATKWLKKEQRAMHWACLGHTYPSGSDGDGMCKDCGFWG